MGDIEAVNGLYRRSSLSNANDRENLLNNPDALLWPSDSIASGATRVALDADSGIVGFATIGPLHDGVVELVDLFVDPEWTRRGVATLLMEDAVERAQRDGARWVEVTANPHAAEFYGHAGFVRFADAQTRFGPAPRLRRATSRELSRSRGDPDSLLQPHRRAP